MEDRSTVDAITSPGSDRDEADEEAEWVIGGYPKIETCLRDLLIDLIDSAEEVEEVEGVGELVRGRKETGNSVGASSR